MRLPGGSPFTFELKDSFSSPKTAKLKHSRTRSEGSRRKAWTVQPYQNARRLAVPR